ncbi:MAG: DegV family protein, partial [Anaerolineales bacterium]|nr:DegV family protein [Anaerolineales bacterium]
ASVEAQDIADQLQASVNPVELLIGELSPVIGTHVGPGTLGVAFYAD